MGNNVQEDEINLDENLSKIKREQQALLKLKEISSCLTENLFFLLFFHGASGRVIKSVHCQVLYHSFLLSNPELIDSQQARSDVEQIISHWSEQGIIEEIKSKKHLFRERIYISKKGKSHILERLEGFKVKKRNTLVILISLFLGMFAILLKMFSSDNK
ncbi:hypothetical protein ACFL35_05760 [Candidatus Riflebacteria bacterium]